MDVADWLCQPSPQRLNDGLGEELYAVDQWLKDGLPDIGDDDIVGSLADFTGREFLNESPPPNGTSDSLPAPLQQQSTSSDPTSSGEGPTSSGAVCGGSGLGHFSRGGAMRSFSANDLQLLLEKPLGMFPPVASLSAPHGSHMGKASLKGRPALESVPEGAPSQGGPLPPTPPLAVPPNSLPGSGGLDSCASSPALGASPVSAPFLPRPAAEPTTAAAGIPGLAPGVVMATAVAPHTAAAVASVAPQQQLLPTASAAGPLGSAAAPPQPPLTGGGMRSVPSAGSLSTMMHNTLHIPREGSDESPQQQPQPNLEQPLPHHQHQHQQQQHPPQQPQQLLCDAMGLAMGPGQVLQGSAAPPIDLQQPQSQQQQLMVSGCTAVADGVGTVGFGSSAMAAAAAAAAANAFPFSAAAAPTAVLPGVPQACLYGISPYLGTSSAFPIGAYPLGLPLPMSAHALPAHQSPAAVMPATTSDGAVGRPAAAVGAGGAAATTAGGGGGGLAAAPKLRKSQSALELGAWRTSSLGSEGEGLEPAATIAAVGQKMIGRLTAEERLQKILRYRNKRNQRNFNREIKYHCRKTLADSRPRVGGRFARNNDPNSVLPHQTKKAMRMKMETVPETSQQQQLQRVRGARSEAGPGDVAGVMAAAAASDQLPQQDHQQQMHSLQQQQQQASAGASGQLSHGFAGGSLVPAPASSGTTTTTTTSTNSAGDHSAATSAGTAAVAAARVFGGGVPYTANSAVPLPTTAITPDGASGAAMADGTCIAGGLPYTYGMTATMPYAAHSAVPGAVMLPHLGGVPGPLPAAAMDAAQMHHHYAMVTAAAQAAARGVYAHLGLAPNVSALAPQGSVHMQTNLQPQPNGLAGYSVAAAGGAGAAATVNGGSVGAVGMCGAGGGGAAAAAPLNLSAPLVGTRFVDMDPEAVGAAPQPRGSGVGGAGGSCMVVDG